MRIFITDMLINYDITINQLDLNPEKVAQIISGSGSTSLLEKKISEDRFRNTLQYIRDNLLHMVEPRCVTKTMPVHLFREVFSESLPDFSPVYKVAGQWHYAAVFVATIGSFIEMSIRRLLEEGDVYTSSLLDASASVLVENLVGTVQERWMQYLRIDTGENRLIYSTRYSPGYCGWDISGQAALFGYIADADFNVKLMDDYSLQPVKSISGIMVIEEQESESSLHRACSICDDKCRFMRKIKNPETGSG
jgi:hypothetical protein